MKKEEFSSGAVVFTQENGVRKYLLVQENAGHTGLPKGHLEAGETSLQAALREIREETGIDAQILPGFCEEIVYEAFPGVLKHVAFYLARFEHQAVRPLAGEVKQALLLPLNEALSALSFEQTRQVLRSANAYLDRFFH